MLILLIDNYIMTELATDAVDQMESKPTEPSIESVNPPADSEPKVEEKKEEKKEDSSKKKDPEAWMRYQISREREKRVDAENKLKELLERSKEKVPEFNDDNDPNWNKEIEYKIQKQVDERLKESLENLWVKDALQALQYEREQEKFYKLIENSSSKYKELGIEIPTKEETMKMLDTIDKKGITHEQLIAITKLESILSKIKPWSFTPGTGWKPKAERTLTQEEVNANIFKKHKAFWY